MSRADLAEVAPLSALRHMLLLLLLLGMFGAGAELLLLGHTEGWRQWIPLVLIGLGVGVLSWHFTEPTPISTRAVQGAMCVFIAAGVSGVYYHLHESAEFKLESNPSLGGFLLLWEAMRSKNPPALAPAVMVLFGLLGLASTYRHPAVSRDKKIN